MKRALQKGCPLLFLFILTACREKPHPIEKPHGIELATLPNAAKATVFAPAEGHYPELLLHDGHWQGFIDGKPMGIFKNRDQISEFSRIVKQRDEIKGRHPVALISAEGKTPVSQIKIAIHGLAAGGISHLYLHVRSFSGSQQFPTYHAVLLDLSCRHCRLAKYNPNPEPLAIILKENGSVQQAVGDTLTELDDPDADGSLPGLNAALARDAARVKAGNLEPLIRVLLNDATLHQRFVDVLCRLREHGMEPEWSNPDDESVSGPSQ